MKTPDEEITKQLQSIADSEQTLILSFVAPDRAVKVSPVGIAYASIDIDDLYEIENVIEELEDAGKLPKKLHLVIQTPGGLVSVSTKLANYLRKTFDDIQAFIPYEASSGGTVLCLAANRITLGKLANLTPIDPQLPYEGIRVSAASFQRAVNTFEERFGKKRPGEIPPPYQEMCDKIDPVILTEMNKIWQDTASVALSLLEQSYKPKTKEDKDKVMETAFTLTFSPSPHGHMIDADEAQTMGLQVDSSKESEILLKTYKKWVKSMLGVEQATHVIRHFCPSNKVIKGGGDAKRENEKSTNNKAASTNPKPEVENVSRSN